MFCSASNSFDLFPGKKVNVGVIQRAEPAETEYFRILVSVSGRQSKEKLIWGARGFGWQC